jgi:hypothetical protein
MADKDGGAPPHGEELAVHQPRFSLLDAVKNQLSTSQISRLLFVFSVGDDVSQKGAYQELDKFIASREAAEAEPPSLVTGAVVGIGSWVVCLLEGKTDDLIKAFVHLAEHGKDSKPVFSASQFHMIHISELRGVRVFPALVYLPYPKKPEGTAFETSVAERIVQLYTGLLTVGCKVLDAMGFPEDPLSDEAPNVDSATVADQFAVAAKENGALMPTHDLVESIVVSGNVLAYASFYDVFVGPIHLELESSKLWPVPPPLTY